MLNRSTREGVVERLREALNLQTVVRKSTIDAAVALHESRRQWGGRANRDAQELLVQLSNPPLELQRAVARLADAIADFEARVEVGMSAVAAAQRVANLNLVSGVQLPSVALATTFGPDSATRGLLSPNGGPAAQAAHAWLTRESQADGSARSGVLPVVAGMRGMSQWLGGGTKKLAVRIEDAALKLVSQVEADLDILRRLLNEQGRLNQLTYKHGKASTQEIQRLRTAGPLDGSQLDPEHQQNLRRLVTALNSLSSCMTRLLEVG